MKNRHQIYDELMNIWDENRQAFLEQRDNHLRFVSEINKKGYKLPSELHNSWSTAIELEIAVIDFEISSYILSFSLLESFVCLIENSQDSELIAALNRYRRFMEKRFDEVNLTEKKVIELMRCLRNQIFNFDDDPLPAERITKMDNFPLSGSKKAHQVDLIIEKFKICPVCKEPEYHLSEGCVKCGYKNRWINLYQNITDEEVKERFIGNVCKAEEEADREKIIKMFLSRETKKRCCPKCKGENYIIFTGCLHCHYKNPWAEKVILAFAQQQSYLPITEMFMYEVEAKDLP